MRFLVGPLGVTVVIVLLTSSPAFGQWGEVLCPRAGDAVSPGSEIEIEWTALPAEVDEFEVLLSLDDGRHFPLRLTPQLEPELHRLVWQVPHLPSPRARLRLRVGHLGHEVDGPVGPAFKILPGEGLPVAAPRFREGEWWLTRNASGLASGPGPHPGTAVRPCTGRSATSAVARSSDNTVAELSGPRPGTLVPCSAATSCRAIRHLSRQPRSFPLLT